MKRFISILALSAMLFTSLTLSPAHGSGNTLEDIFGGKAPTITLANEKLEALISYTSSKFTDIKKNDWFCASSSKLVGLGGINGYSDGTFKPGNAITTAEFTKLLLAAMGYTQNNDPKVWYANYVAKARELGVVEASDSYSFDGGMQRKDMAKMICRMLKIDPKSSSTPAFSDLSGTDARWIDTAFSEYLIRGYYAKGIRTFKPTGTATRAEVCEMIVRALEYKDNPVLYKELSRAYYKEMDRQKDIEDGTYVMPPLSEEQKRRLAAYPENKDAEVSKDGKNHYMSNKEFIKTFGEQEAKEMIRKAKGYLEAFNNVDYRVIDKIGFKDEVKTFLSQTGYNIDKNENKITHDENLDIHLLWVKQNNIIAEGKYLSEVSKVYVSNEGRVRIRGVLQWRIKECSNPGILNVKIGQWYEDDTEIELARWGGNPETFSKQIDLHLNFPISSTPEWSGQ